MCDYAPPRLPAEESGPQWEAAGREALQLAARLQMEREQGPGAWDRAQQIEAAILQRQQRYLLARRKGAQQRKRQSDERQQTIRDAKADLERIEAARAALRP